MGRRRLMGVFMILCALASVGTTRGDAQAIAFDPAVERAIGRTLVDTMSRHLLLTPIWQATGKDSARAYKVAEALRRAIVKYQDTSAALAEGYRKTPPFDGQQLFHFGSIEANYREMNEFDPARPGNLVYRRDGQGKLVLVGAMYSAPPDATFAQLNERVPLGIARWHKHVKICHAKPGNPLAGLLLRNGHPLFGPDSPVDTPSECEELGGDFVEVQGSWMVHAFVFEGDDLGTIYGDGHHAHRERHGKR